MTEKEKLVVEINNQIELVKKAIIKKEKILEELKKQLNDLNSENWYLIGYLIFSIFFKICFNKYGFNKKDLML